MAINFSEQVNPTATNMDKDVHVKVVKLVASDFAVGNTASVKAVLPADSTILSISYWKKTQFSGGGVTAMVLTISTPSVAAYVTNFDVLTPVVGTQDHMSPATNIMQPLSLPLGSDIVLNFTGGASTGAPTAGEMYVIVTYVR